MDKFLKVINYQSRIEILKLPRKKSPCANGFAGEFYQHKEKWSPILRLLPSDEEHFLTNSTGPNLPCCQNRTHTHKKIIENILYKYRRSNLRLVNRIQQHRERDCISWPREISPRTTGWVRNIINVIHDTYRIKNKNNLITDIEKELDKIQHPFFITTLNKLGIKGNLLTW